MPVSTECAAALLFFRYPSNKSIIPSTDAIQLSLTLKMTTAQVVETSVTINNNSPIQDYVQPDDQTLPTFEEVRVLST